MKGTVANSSERLWHKGGHGRSQQGYEKELHVYDRNRQRLLMMGLLLCDQRGGVPVAVAVDG
jgi:hypothetical protein